jgi:hypothetical protein
MPVCELFFGLVNSRPRARFESSSFFGAVADFLDGGLAWALGQSGDGIVGVTETMESQPVGKICWTARANPSVLAARLECGVPVPFVIPIRCCAVQDRAAINCRGGRRKMGIGRDESSIAFAPQG